MRPALRPEASKAKSWMRRVGTCPSLGRVGRVSTRLTWPCGILRRHGAEAVLPVFSDVPTARMDQRTRATCDAGQGGAHACRSIARQSENVTLGCAACDCARRRDHNRESRTQDMVGSPGRHSGALSCARAEVRATGLRGRPAVDSELHARALVPKSFSELRRSSAFDYYPRCGSPRAEVLFGRSN